MSITVINKHEFSGDFVHICRPTPLGNPFIIGRDGDREAVVQQYSSWLLEQMRWNDVVRKEMEHLLNLWAYYGVLNIGCVCAPEQCHGDVVKYCLESLRAGVSEFRPGDPVQWLAINGNWKQGRVVRLSLKGYWVQEFSKRGFHLTTKDGDHSLRPTEFQWPWVGKVLSLRQPWAWAIFNTDKDVENRDWGTEYRGKLWIHVSKTFRKKQFEAEVKALEYLGYRVPPREQLTWGGLIGSVELYDCKPPNRVNEISRWYSGQYGLLIRDKQEIPFIPLAGQRGLFDLPLLFDQDVRHLWRRSDRSLFEQRPRLNSDRVVAAVR
jgi:hypothetical protein